MKFSDLFKLMPGFNKIVIDKNDEWFTYTVKELTEDILFYEEIKDREVVELWYSIVYNANVIKLK